MRRAPTAALLATLLLLAAAAAQQGSTIELRLRGGEHEGSYTVVSEDPMCTHGYAGEGIWGNQYSDFDVGPDAFSSLQLMADADDAAGGTNAFVVTVSFGDFFAGTDYDIRPQLGSGQGTVTVDDQGDSATVTISGETDEGVAIEATIECHQVLRAADWYQNDQDDGYQDDRADDDYYEYQDESEEYEYDVSGPVTLEIDGRRWDLTAGKEDARCLAFIDEETEIAFRYASHDDSRGEHSLELLVVPPPPGGANGPSTSTPLDPGASGSSTPPPRSLARGAEPWSSTRSTVRSGWR